ncbi:uncharacterized protein LOC127797225 isoform X2 [Diospyros lotus]|uniref:uncharacterized protein LOC127797225 isoform X2 n=1 Tax=Diospyros lotus TaxID=55363 RepID=UPI00225719D6|nr:uncharacterized protein LOC127797225 isoform X2 [Diospyros lotus]
MASTNMSSLSPPVFDGENYQVWAVKMKAHLRGLSLWQWVESEREIPPLGNNPTLNQIRAHEEAEAKAPRALSQIHAAVSESIFSRIMACETAKEAWDILKELYQGNARTKRIQVLNLKRNFEILRMNEKDTIQEFSEKLMTVVNKIRLMGEELPDSRIVEKVLISLPERFEAKISSLEDSRDISQITLAELIGALQAQEQRRIMRNEESEKTVEGAYLAKSSSSKKKGKIPECDHCKKLGHEEKDCWHKGKPQCFQCKRFGHLKKDCRFNLKEQASTVKAIEGAIEEETLF